MRVYKTEEFMNDDQNIHIFKAGVSKTPMDNMLHTHEFIEIVYMLSGRMIHVVDGQKYEMKHGDIIFMNYGCTHEFVSDDEYSYVNILFSPELIGKDITTPSSALAILSLTTFNDMRSDSDFGMLRFSGEQRKEIEDIIFAMLKEYAGKQTSWQTVMGNYLNILIVKMLRKTEMGIEQDDMNDTWTALAEYIDANLGAKLTGVDLARKCFYNPSYFSRVFKEKFGMTFMEYITKKRLDCAIDLLRNTELSVDEIGHRVGFSDGKSFYHAFARYFNSTPSQYRKSKM